MVVTVTSNYITRMAYAMTPTLIMKVWFNHAAHKVNNWWNSQDVPYFSSSRQFYMYSDFTYFGSLVEMWKKIEPIQENQFSMIDIEDDIKRRLKKDDIDIDNNTCSLIKDMLENELNDNLIKLDIYNSSLHNIIIDQDSAKLERRNPIKWTRNNVLFRNNKDQSGGEVEQTDLNISLRNINKEPSESFIYNNSEEMSTLEKPVSEWQSTYSSHNASSSNMATKYLNVQQNSNSTTKKKSLHLPITF